jgi:hypothetical protein
MVVVLKVAIISYSRMYQALVTGVLATPAPGSAVDFRGR